MIPVDDASWLDNEKLLRVIHLYFNLLVLIVIVFNVNEQR